MIRQSRHIQPSPRTNYLLFLTQFVVRVCVGTFFAGMVECWLFSCCFPTESSPPIWLTPPWSLNVASPAKSPSSSPEKIHTFSIFGGSCKVDGTAHYAEDYATQRIYVTCGVWHRIFVTCGVWHGRSRCKIMSETVRAK